MNRNWIAREGTGIFWGWEVIEKREGEDAAPIIAQGVSEHDARLMADAPRMMLLLRDAAVFPRNHVRRGLWSEVKKVVADHQEWKEEVEP